MALTYPPTEGLDLSLTQAGPQNTNVPYGGLPDPLIMHPFAPYNYRFESFTIEFYLYARDIQPYRSLLTTQQDGGSVNTDGLDIYLYNGYICCSLDYYSVTTSGIVANQWMHVAISFTRAGDYFLAIDGVRQSTGTSTSRSITQESETLTVAGNQYSPANAILANVRLWNHGRTVEQLVVDKDTDYPSGASGLLWAFSLAGTDPVETATTGSLAGYAFAVKSVYVDGPEDFTTDTGETIRDVPPRPVIVGMSSSAQEPMYFGQISGIVTVKGDPAAQRVLCFDRKTGKKMAETTSDSNGAYTLTGLNPDAAHYVVALDKNLEYNGVIADNITPEVPA